MTTTKKIRRVAQVRLKEAVLSGKVSVGAVATRVARSEETVMLWVAGKLPPSTVLAALAEVTA